MPDAREEILSRIRAATRDSAGAEIAAEREAIPRNYIAAGQLDPEARLSLFIERLRDYDAHVVETEAASLPEAILGVLREQGERKVIVAEGFPLELLPGNFSFLPETQADVDDLNGCDGMVTGCTVAIAATGTIVLTHGPGEGSRRLTLLPDRHLCVVRADQVVETVPEAMQRLAPFAVHPLTFISGPSATADIEMTRIRGVHGPRFLDIVLVR